VQTAFEQTKNQVAEILRRELSISIEAAISKITQSSAGTISGIIGG
jgi:hypothetical protein